MRGVINWYHRPFAGFPELVVTSNPVNSTEPGERPITFGLNSITGRMSLVCNSCYSARGTALGPQDDGLTPARMTSFAKDWLGI